jgi:hypothetical protein
VRNFALFLANLRYQDPESEGGHTLTIQFINEATNAIISDNPTLELVQTHLLLSMAHFGIGDGRSCWRELGASLLRSD